MKDDKGELRAPQIEMEAEEKKTQMSDEIIKGLRSDKLRLQQKVAHLEELLKQQAEEKQVQQVKPGILSITAEC